MPLLGALAASTTHIGLGATRSTTYSQPYSLAREFATLDHLSAGRVAWNVVTSVNRGEAANFGLTQTLDHDTRYDRAEEFLDITDGLWQGWEADALQLDTTSGRYADASRVQALHHQGRHFQVAGPLNIPRSPQGRPVILQAGSSARGQDFAARRAEVVFGIQPDLAHMQRFYQDLKGRLPRFGRQPDDLKVLTAVMPFIADSRAAALELQTQHNAAANPLVGLSTLSSHMDVDFSGFDPDAPLGDVAVGGIQGLFRLVQELTAERQLSLRDVGRLYAQGVLVPQIAGTPADVADWLQHIVEQQGADGFVLTPVHLPHGFDDFVAHVVPLLQQRGLLRRTYTASTLRGHLSG